MRWRSQCLQLAANGPSGFGDIQSPVFVCRGFFSGGTSQGGGVADFSFFLFLDMVGGCDCTWISTALGIQAGQRRLTNPLSSTL